MLAHLQACLHRKGDAVTQCCFHTGTASAHCRSVSALLQTTVHLKGKSECFECQPRPAPKGFPICTIRNTPEKPIHCIVWAKDLLFERLFGAPEETNDLDEVTAEDANASEADKAAAAGAPPPNLHFS